MPEPAGRGSAPEDAFATEAPPIDFPGSFRERLQESADVDLGDHLSSRVGTPMRELTNAPRGGARYPCDAVLAGKSYAKLYIDVGCGDAPGGEPERIVGDDLLSFAGIPPATVLATSKPQQFAEKLHAYSFPWSGRVNTRTKALVDLGLLLERGLLDAAAIRSALRATHPLPASLAPPPASWPVDFPAMAAEAGLSTGDYLEAFAILVAFWDAGSLGEEG